MNYLSLSSIFGTTTPDGNGERDRDRNHNKQNQTSVRDRDRDPRKTLIIGEPPTSSRLKSTLSIRSQLTTAGAPITEPTPLSSLVPISTRSRTNSTTSLSSLPSCVSVTSFEQTPGPDTASSVNDDGCSIYPSFIPNDQVQSRQKLRKRRASTSMLPHECSGDVMDDTFKIKVTCNNCYLWRKKCLKQEDKLKELQSELDRVKMNNMELLNKNNLNTKTFILRNKEMKINLSEYKKELRELKQLNKDQLDKNNDMKHENDALKQQNNNLRQENKSLHDDIEETKEKGRKALNVINKLKDKVIQIQAQIKSEDSAIVKDAKNPWLWVLRMT